MNRYEGSEKLFQKRWNLFGSCRTVFEMSLSAEVAETSCSFLVSTYVFNLIGYHTDSLSLTPPVYIYYFRFLQLQVMGFQSNCLLDCAADRSILIHFILKEYVTFPILMSNKNFSEAKWQSFAQLVGGIFLFVCVCVHCSHNFANLICWLACFS